MTEQGPPPPSERELDRLLYRRKGMSGSEFAGVGMQFGITIVGFLVAGLWLDKRLGSSPWLMIGMVFAGATVGFWTMYRAVSKSDRKRK